MRFKKPVEYDGSTAVMDGQPDPDAELVAADLERADAQHIVDELAEALKLAEGALATVQAAHRAATDEKLRGGKVDLSATRAAVADCEDAVSTVALHLADAKKALADADAKYQPLAAEADRRRLQQEKDRLARDYRAALATAREHFAHAIAATRAMEQAANALTVGEHRLTGGPALAATLAKEADGLPLVNGTYRAGQLSW